MQFHHVAEVFRNRDLVVAHEMARKAAGRLPRCCDPAQHFEQPGLHLVLRMKRSDVEQRHTLGCSKELRPHWSAALEILRVESVRNLLQLRLRVWIDQQAFLHFPVHGDHGISPVQCEPFEKPLDSVPPEDVPTPWVAPRVEGPWIPEVDNQRQLEFPLQEQRQAERREGTTCGKEDFGPGLLRKASCGAEGAGDPPDSWIGNGDVAQAPLCETSESGAVSEARAGCPGTFRARWRDVVQQIVIARWRDARRCDDDRFPTVFRQILHEFADTLNPGTTGWRKQLRQNQHGSLPLVTHS